MRFRQQRVITNLDAEKNFVQAETELNNQQEQIDALDVRIDVFENVEDWIEIGSGGSAPAFTNSWVNDGGATIATAAFYKDPFGVVHLKGRIKNGSAINTVAFTLPTGYRPAEFLNFPIVSNNAFGQVAISTGGAVNPTNGSTTWVSLAGISFRAA